MRFRIILLLTTLIVHQCWTHPSYGEIDTATATVQQQEQQHKDNPDRDGESSKRIIGSSVVTSVSVILNGDEPEFTDALGMRVPKPQIPHLQVASPINLLNPDRYEFYTFDDNGELVKRLMTMQEIQSIVANGDGEGPTIIHSAPIDDQNPEKNVQDIVKSVQSVLNREVESNKNASDMQPILDTPDVSSSWSMILPAIFGNTGGEIFPQNKPQQVVMTPDSDVVEATTKSNKGKPSGKPKPQKKKNGNRRKTTTKRISTTTEIPSEQEAEASEVFESTTRKVFINNHEVVQSIEQGEDLAKKRPVVQGRPASTHATKRPQATKQKNKTKRPATTTLATSPEPATSTEPMSIVTSTSAPTEPSSMVPEQEPTTQTQVVTTVAPSSTTISSTVPEAGTEVKEKPPQKKRKKPTRKPIDVTTERHISHYHRRKQTTARPHGHHTSEQSNEELHEIAVHHGHKHRVTTTSTPTTTVSTTASTSVPSTSSTTTTTTQAPTTTTTTTTTTQSPTSTTTTTQSPTTTTTTTAPTHKPVSHHPHTTKKPKTTTTTPTPTSTTTSTEEPPTTLFTFATYRPTPPTTATQAQPTYRPPTSSTNSYQHTPSTSKKPFYAPPSFIPEEQQVDDHLISSADFAPAFKTEKISLPEVLTEKEQDQNTKLSFDQILQSLKEETSTDDVMEASESEEVQMPARLPPNNEMMEALDETESPLSVLNLATFEKEQKPINKVETLDLSTIDPSRAEVTGQEGPVVVITGRPQIHTSNKPVVPLIYISPETSTTFEEPTRTTVSLPEDRTEATITSREEEDVTIKDNVVKFEPLFADIQDPVVTTFTTTEAPETTTTYDILSTYEDESERTTLAPMESLLQKIDNIISMSLKSNDTVEPSVHHNQQAIPHISALTMNDFKNQAATMASILEDHNTSQLGEITTTELSSIETKDEIELLLSDVINQMTQNQQPTIATATTISNDVVRREKPNQSQDETAQRLSNFAQINPALQLSAGEIKKTALRQPTHNDSIGIVTSVLKGNDENDQPQEFKDEVSDENTSTPDVENETNYVLISQGNNEYPENTVEPLGEDIAMKEATTTSQTEEVTEVSKENQDTENEMDEGTTMKVDSMSEESTEEEEQMIVVTSSPHVAKEEEKSTEISDGESTVVSIESDTDVHSEMETEVTTIAIPTLQAESHLLHGEDPYIKLGEIGAKPTMHGLAQLIYGQDAKVHQQMLSQRLENDEKESEPLVETTTLQIEEGEEGPKTPTVKLSEPVEEDKLEPITEHILPSNQPKTPLPTAQPMEESMTKIESNPPLEVVDEKKPLPTFAPSTTIPTKKIPNTLKPVSYFNKQPSLMINDQKFNNFQSNNNQQRPVVRPASLSNLKMPQSGATRPPVKLEPSPPDSKGLDASTIGLDDDLRQFSQLCNELAFTYWRSITSEKISSARSLVISPFALTSMLSMVFLGARGSTSGEMNEVLKLDDMVTFNPHLVFKNVTESVERATDSDIASSAFVREAFSDRANGKILQFFKEKTQQFYSGHVEEVNFNVVNDVIRRRTNLLVKRHTMGKVLEYLRTNSVWVNGPLATISANLFQTDCSRASYLDRDGEMFFQVHPSIRQRRLVPIPAVLFRTGFTAGYEPNLDATVVAFGRVFETVSTIYVMPGQHGSLAPADSLDLLEKNLMETALTKDSWRSLLVSLMERPGLEVQLPRFSHRSFVNASLGLQKMGLKGLFNSELADLRGLTGLAAKDIYLSDMIQINTFSTCAEDKIGDHHHVEMYPAPPIRKRNKDVRENEDPESDSSESVIDFGSLVQDTGMGRAFYDDLLDPKFLELPLPLRPRQARIPDAPRLRFDRPFLYFVRHNPTGMILFMGRFNPRLLP